MTDKHIMLDLETMGTGPDAAIVAIGAVQFDFESPAMGAEFYRTIDLGSAMARGGTVDASTINWWLEQSDEARLALKYRAIDIVTALHDFRTWIEPLDPSPYVWGNSAAFDNVILRSAYERMHRTPPWSHWKDRCYRTLKSLKPDMLIERRGTHHNALDDAISQALHARQIMDHIRKGAVL